MNIVKVEASMRVDFAGGTLDIPPLHLFHPSACVINAAIDIKARVVITPHDTLVVVSRDRNIRAEWSDPRHVSWEEYPELELILRLVKSFNPLSGMKIEVTSEAPAGSGLGGSSAIAIALTAGLARWFGVTFTPDRLIEYAKSIETQTLRVPTGYQDYWSAVYGGLHIYERGLDGTLHIAPVCTEGFSQELERHMLLVYVGKPHDSANINWEIFRNHINGDAITIDFLEELSANARFIKEALAKEEMLLVAEALRRDWDIRKRVLPSMTTAEIEELCSRTAAEGVLAARACGAGGGGSVLLLIDPTQRAKLEYIIEGLSMRVLPAKISKKGVEVTSEQQ